MLVFLACEVFCLALNDMIFVVPVFAKQLDSMWQLD
jgi:hypothetical protein